MIYLDKLVNLRISYIYIFVFVCVCGAREWSSWFLFFHSISFFLHNSILQRKISIKIDPKWSDVSG